MKILNIQNPHKKVSYTYDVIEDNLVITVRDSATSHEHIDVKTLFTMITIMASRSNIYSDSICVFDKDSNIILNLRYPNDAIVSSYESDISLAEFIQNVFHIYFNL